MSRGRGRTVRRVAAMVGALLALCAVGWTALSHLAAPTEHRTRPTSSGDAPTAAQPEQPTRTMPSGAGPIRAELRRARNAPLPVLQDKTPRDVVRIRYASKKDEARLVIAKVAVRQPPRSASPRTGALVRVSCATDGSASREAASIENVERGETLRQEPRLLYRAPRSGTVECRVVVVPFFGEPDIDTEVPRLDVLTGAEVSAGDLQPAWTREWGFAFPTRTGMVSELLSPGEVFGQHPPRAFTLPPSVRRIEVQSDHKVTNCFYRGGSSDITTPRDSLANGVTTRRDLCVRPFPDVPLAKVRILTDLTRLDEAGYPCAPTLSVVDEVRVVSGPAHHARLNNSAVIALPTGRTCSDRYSLTSRILNADPTGRGMDVVIHAPDERLAVLKPT